MSKNYNVDIILQKCVCVYMYVCMYVCTYVHTFVCILVKISLAPDIKSFEHAGNRNSYTCIWCEVAQY